MKKVIILTLGLLCAVSCSNDNDNIVKRLAQEPATVREVKGTNDLFVLDLSNTNNGLYSQYVVPSGTLPAEYKEDGLSVFISGDVTSNYVAIDGYILENNNKGNTINLNGNYNTIELRTVNDANNIATGTVIGSYSNGWIEFLVQVDEKYPIGETFEYIGQPGNCIRLPNDGIYQNMIRVQPLEGGSKNQKITFTYREFREEEDVTLFLFSHGNASCMSPLVPLYVITDYQIIK